MSKGLEQFKLWARLKVTKGLKINPTNLMTRTRHQFTLASKRINTEVIEHKNKRLPRM